MSKNLETSITINASISCVWLALSTLDEYKYWNTRTHFSTRPVLHESQKMHVKLFGFSLSVPVTILALSKNDEFMWQGGIAGLFTGKHYFRLVENTNGSTTFIQGEDFSGLLVSILMPFLKKELFALYADINKDIKLQCEKT